jgi:hypothetical protein
VHFPVDTWFTGSLVLQYLHPCALCHLQTNHQFESIKLPPRYESVVVAAPAGAPGKAAQKQVVTTADVAEASQQLPLVATVNQDTFTVNLDKVLYVVFGFWRLHRA